jgi:hypothetical protein
MAKWGVTLRAEANMDLDGSANMNGGAPNHRETAATVTAATDRA